MQPNYFNHLKNSNINGPITTIIIEDDPVWSETLYKDLEKHPEIKVLETITSVENAKRRNLKHQPHLLFINAETPEMNGIEGLHEITRFLHSNACVVFYCESEKYLIDALRVSAFDFLSKPYQHEDLNRIIERVKYKFGAGNGHFEQSIRRLLSDDRKFALQTVTGLLIIKRSEVIYFQHNSSLHIWQIFLTENRTAKLRGSTTAKEILNISHFFCQVNHNMIVNIDYLASIDTHSRCLLHPPYDCIEITVSRRYFSKLKEMLEII